MRFFHMVLSTLTIVVASHSALGGLFLIDFCATTDQARCLGSADGWDAFTSAAPGEVFALTDWSMQGNDDVTMTLIPNDDEGLLNMWPNFTSPPDDGTEFNGIEVPYEAVADYWYRNPDTAGLSALLRFDDLDPGSYDVTVFEGRVTDGFQEGKIWVGDEEGSGEPDDANTGNFALSADDFQTVNVTVNAGDSLFYRHLEDGTGGISGMIIQSAAPLAAPGDFNRNGELDGGDIDLLTVASASAGNPSEFDLNSDSLVNQQDVNVWIRDLFNSWVGDANLDGEFNSADLVSVFSDGRFETDDLAAWTEGDWNGDGRFGSADFVAAFTDGGYEQGVRPDVMNVPEPGASPILWGGFVLALRVRRALSHRP